MPNLKQTQTEVFLDFEGIPDKNSNYLIGLILRTDKVENEYSFWANNKDDETQIFIELIELTRWVKLFEVK
jgi:predicted RecB family nuclease